MHGGAEQSTFRRDGLARVDANAHPEGSAGVFLVALGEGLLDRHRACDGTGGQWEGRLDAVASWELAGEIAEVLRRPKLRRYHISEDDVRSLLVLLAPLLPAVDIELALRDPEDAPVVSTALAARVDAVVTGAADGERRMADDLLDRRHQQLVD